MGSQTTHGDRIELAFQRPNHSATLSVQPSEFELSLIFLFLISIDSNSNPPLDPHFWSEIDYCWFVSYLNIFYLETDEEIFDRKLDKYSLEKMCFVKRKLRQRWDSNSRTETVLD